jgi:hypothetical protein
MAKINSMEAATGFHLQIDGSIAVTNLQNMAILLALGGGREI